MSIVYVHAPEIVRDVYVCEPIERVLVFKRGYFYFNPNPRLVLDGKEYDVVITVEILPAFQKLADVLQVGCPTTRIKYLSVQHLQQKWNSSTFEVAASSTPTS